jgi:serine/threonine protein kinase
MIEIGKVIGRYEVSSLLGAGGMGQVYRARDIDLKRHVALKLLSRNFAQDEDRLRRLRQEALAASALNHPNIITIYEIGESEFGYQSWAEALAILNRSNEGLNHLSSNKVAVELV